MDRHVIGQQLKRNGQKDGHQQRVGRRNAHDVASQVGQRGRRGVGQCDDPAAARFHLFQIAQRLVVHGVLGDQDDDRQVFVDQGDRPVFHLARGIAFGVYVGNLLELERALQRDRIVDPAAEVQKVRGVAVLAGEAGNRVRLLQRLLDQRGQGDQIGDERPGTGVVEHAAALTEQQGQEEESRQLGGERLG